MAFLFKSFYTAIATMYVFRNGKPVESFTHANSNFKLENIMEKQSSTS